jgi:hypothetical protein
VERKLMLAHSAKTRPFVHLYNSCSFILFITDIVVLIL